MLIFKMIFLGYLGLGALYWLAQLVLSLRVVKSVRLISDLKGAEPDPWPRVSEIVTARNEADTIIAAMSVRLEDDYPNLEIILIDDRSDDGTSEIADEIARNDPRVKAVHLKELPEGWLGKLHAMHQGVKRATGDWLLFSDVDVQIRKGALKKSIAYCETRKLDLLAGLPEIFPVNFALDIFFSVFIRFICLAARVWAIEDEKSKASAGSGSFNLVRRTAFEKTKGFEWLKLEPADDVALGQMLKESGARCSLVNGRGYIGVYFYRSLRELAIGSERALFTSIGNLSFWRLALMAAIVFLLELSPFFALIPVGVPHLWISGLAMICVAIYIQVLLNQWAGRNILPSFFFPIGSIALPIVTLRAGILGAIRGGIYWRGTFYPSGILKEGKRYKLY